METKDCIEIAAILFSPVIAVVVSMLMQGRKEKRDHVYRNKFAVFSTIIGQRHAMGHSIHFINAINLVPIVFNGDHKIINSYNKFIGEHKNGKSTETLPSLNDLLVEMGRNLSYTEMNNSWLANSFYPDAAWADIEVKYNQNLKYLKENNLLPLKDEVKK